MEPLVERYRYGEAKLIDLLVAVLLERGGPVTPEEAGARLAELGVEHWRGDLALVLKRSMAPCPEVTLDDQGRFAIALFDPQDYRLDRRLRSIWPPEPRPEPRPEAGNRPSPEELHRRWREQEVAERVEAAALRRVLIHAVPRGRGGKAPPRAVALLDAQSREIETFVDDELAAVPGRLEGYDLVIGISPRPLLRQLGLDAEGFEVADLDRPQKTRQLNKRGRILKITNEMLISATLDNSRPLGQEAKYREYLEKGHLGRLRRRLESDVKALWTYYRFGVIHWGVRLRWGFLDELIPSRWGRPGDLSLGRLQTEALETGKRLELVVGRPPAWSDPWGRTTICEVVKTGDYSRALVPVIGEPTGSGVIYDARFEERPAWDEVRAGAVVRLQLTLEQRDLVLEHCLLPDPDLARRLRLAPLVAPATIEIAADPDRLEHLGVSVSFAANQARDPDLRHRLDLVRDRILAVERWAVN